MERSESRTSAGSSTLLVETFTVILADGKHRVGELKPRQDHARRPAGLHLGDDALD